MLNTSDSYKFEFEFELIFLLYDVQYIETKWKIRYYKKHKYYTENGLSVY